MRVVFPSNSDLGLTGTVYNHFGSAPFFVIVDTESGAYEIKTNMDKDHAHGQCQPLKALGNIAVEAVVVGGIGRGALNKLASSGIRVLRGVEGTVKTNLEMMKRGELHGFKSEDICISHGISGKDGCGSH
ncbi:MAG: NifB/NifX family molybdenum-iron cluster-binding protein [Desulfamplus sp.]|nr:NifB/NifX family molybdenum-iron cluster-binding protein [Desulfamplus sp.]